MIEGFQPADYALCGLAVVMAVTGLFRGFSGTLAFVLATVAAFFAATFGWTYSASLTDVLWMRGAGVLVATLLAFGFVRLLVKKTVNCLLAQPSDALLGCLLGVLLAALVLLAWARSGAYLEYSVLAPGLAGHVG